MASTKTNVLVTQNGEVMPLLRIVDNNRDQIVVNFRSLPGEHLSIHLRNEGDFQITHSMPNKPPSVWDEQRVEVAKYLGFEKPEKHRNYTLNITRKSRPSNSTEAGFHCIGRLFEFSPRTTKCSNRAVSYEVSTTPFMIDFYFVPNAKTSVCGGVVTSLGELYLRFRNLA